LNERLAVVKDYVNQHYGDDLRLNDLAALACMSPSALSRNYKSFLGENLFSYIIDLRLSHAERMLWQTDEDVRMVAFECGFSTLSNFNRLFKRRNGCTPTEYRARYLKQNKR